MTKKVYEYLSSQDEYDFKLLRPKKVNLVNSRKVNLASLELS